MTMEWIPWQNSLVRLRASRYFPLWIVSGLHLTHSNRKNGYLQIQETQNLFWSDLQQKSIKNKTFQLQIMYLYCWEKSIFKKKNHQNLNSLQIRKKLNINFGIIFNLSLKYRVLAGKKKRTSFLVTESYDYITRRI